MTLHYRISRSDYERASRLHTRPRAAFKVAGLLLLFSAAAALFFAAHMFFTAGHGLFTAILILCGLTYFTLLFLVLIPRFVRRSYVRQGRLAGLQTVDVCEGGLVLGNSVGQGSLPWASVLRWKASKHVVIVYVSDGRFIILPGHAFPSAEGFRMLEQLLDEKVGPPAR